MTQDVPAGEPRLLVLATVDSKGLEAAHLCDRLRALGAQPLLVDLALRPHGGTADFGGGDLAKRAGSSWEQLATMDRSSASEVMVAGALAALPALLADGELAGAIGIGGANGTAMACSVMRALPPLMPKVMLSAVAATGAAQWYVAESDIAMFPTIGDTPLNRITRAVIDNACRALVAMADGWRDGRESYSGAQPDLVAISSFGGTAPCVERVAAGLTATGLEVIQFHASGAGGRALESLVRRHEIAGVVDVTTHELADDLVGGVYSAGAKRLTAAAEIGVPMVVCPGAIDHANFWVGQVPGRYADREFFRYNATNLLMRTTAEELGTLGRLMADRLNAATGPFVVLIPARGFSEHTSQATYDLDGRPFGRWRQPEADASFGEALQRHLVRGRLEVLDMHINDLAFADACLAAFAEVSAASRAGASS